MPLHTKQFSITLYLFTPSYGNTITLTYTVLHTKMVLFALELTSTVFMFIKCS